MKVVVLVVFAAVVLLCQQPVYSSPTGTDKTVQYHDVTPRDMVPFQTNRRQTRQAGGCTCLVRVYDHANYLGRQLVISQQNAEFTNDFFNDRVESIRVEGNCKWLFYQDSNFLGTTHLLHENYYASAPRWGGSGNRISSARALPPNGVTAILLFQHSNYQGRMVVLYASEDHLPSLDFSDHISSIIITGGSWTLFEHSEHQGRQTTIGPGDYPDVHNLHVGGDSISSVRRN